MKHFKYELDQVVALSTSRETGKVVGRAEYTNSSNTYFVRYQTADGRQVEAWWAEDH